MRAYNFSAGPSILPVEALEQAKDELINYNNSGMSVMEISHRSRYFDDIINQAKQDLRDLMEIPENYQILFLQGGASLQFSMVPLNLKGQYQKAAYINTGMWSKKAIKEAKKVLAVEVLASSEESTFSYIPEIDQQKIGTDLDYFYITSNNTIYGTEFKKLPDTKGVPIVADMSSNILCRPIKVADYGVIFAGAQKNMGPAGLTVVIIRQDLIGNAEADIPTMLDYKTHAEADSMFNTPPVYSIYMAGKVFQWIKNLGGLTEMEKINNKKAALLYDYIDGSDFYSTCANKADRSIMNITFVCNNKELDSLFVEQAAKQNLVNLKGHRSVGGMRASIYNAMPIEGVEALIEFMKKFEQENA